MLQALHGRAPSLATGVKRAKPDTLVFTIQGDGDMVNEGLQEVIHAAARGENITCVMLNNGVFGETGGHITAATVMGQRTKNTLDGRDAKDHGYPIRLSNLLAELEGAAYVARGAVNTAGNVAKTRRMITRAFETQLRGEGFSFLEILTMCPTGWFIETKRRPTTSTTPSPRPTPSASSRTRPVAEADGVALTAWASTDPDRPRTPGKRLRCREEVLTCHRRAVSRRVGHRLAPSSTPTSTRAVAPAWRPLGARARRRR